MVKEIICFVVVPIVFLLTLFNINKWHILRLISLLRGTCIYVSLLCFVVLYYSVGYFLSSSELPDNLTVLVKNSERHYQFNVFRNDVSKSQDVDPEE